MKSWGFFIIFVETIRDMEDLFATYEQALALKELGFNEPCLGIYYGNEKNFIISETLITNSELDSYNSPDSEITTPLKSQVFKWFRDKYNLKSCIMFRTSMEDDKEYYDWLIKGQKVVYRHFKTYEESESACIDKLIEIIKEKKL
jgi:hypothetical protein